MFAVGLCSARLYKTTKRMVWSFLRAVYNLSFILITIIVSGFSLISMFNNNVHRISTSTIQLYSFLQTVDSIVFYLILAICIFFKQSENCDFLNSIEKFNELLRSKIQLNTINKNLIYFVRRDLLLLITYMFLILFHFMLTTENLLWFEYILYYYQVLFLFSTSLVVIHNRQCAHIMLTIRFGIVASKKEDMICDDLQKRETIIRLVNESQKLRRQQTINTIE